MTMNLVYFLYSKEERESVQKFLNKRQVCGQESRGLSDIFLIVSVRGNVYMSTCRDQRKVLDIPRAKATGSFEPPYMGAVT